MGPLQPYRYHVFFYFHRGGSRGRQQLDQGRHWQRLAAFTPKRQKKFLRVPTLRETGMEFQFYMQRSVVGAPGMSTAAQQYYQRLFKSVFDSKQWQATGPKTA